MKIVSVLITCFNRKDKTLICLRSLQKSVALLSSAFKVKVYLVDDGSTDGTSDSVKVEFPEVKIIKGSGQLYWAGGMRLAWLAAIQGDSNYFLLLNDDTFLYEDSLSRILDASEKISIKKGRAAVLIGSTIEKELGLISYGGRKLYSKLRPNSYSVFSDTEFLECDLGNANIMLIEKSIVQRIGILSNRFTHGIADYEYTLRAKKSGIDVVVIPGILGVCANDHAQNWLSNDKPLSERIKYLYSPKGLAYKEYLYLIRKHFVLSLPEAFLKLWIKTLFPKIYDRFKKV